MSKKSGIRYTTRALLKRTGALVIEPIFIISTVIVHGAMLAAAALFYYLESGANPALLGMLDSVYWSVTTMMTVGYGDIVPVTDAGKVLAIGLMIFGSIISVGYTALFVGVLVMPELRGVERRMETQILDEEIKIEHLAVRLAAAADALQKRLDK